MHSSLIKRLSAIVVNRPQRPPRRSDISSWLEQHGLIAHLGKGTGFKPGAIEQIERLLRSEGVNPFLTATLNEHATRSQARKVAAYEKVGNHILARTRSSVRAAPGRPLRLDSEIHLPTGASLDIDNSVAKQCRHQVVMVIENRECFDRLDELIFEPAVFVMDPLVLFRGSPFVSAGSTSLLEQLDLPAYVFGDYDPSGINIAAHTHGAVGLVLPPPELIEKEIRRAPNHEQYLSQIAQVARTENDFSEWARDAWRHICHEQCAIPQESFLRT